MSNRVLYILGAGASCNSIPAVRAFKEATDRFRRCFYNNAEGWEDSKNEWKRNKDFWKDFDVIMKELGSSFSPDTLARVYHLAGDDSKHKGVKNLIGLIVDSSQRFRGLDVRYDVFLGAVLKKVGKTGLQFPDNLSILSWNYDLQPELFVSKVRRRFRDFKRGDINDFLNRDSYSDRLFSLNKLNGDVSRDNTFNQLGKYPDTYVRTVEQMSLEFQKVLYVDDLYPNIEFGWEGDTIEKIKSSANLFRSVKEVVVIGYTFPAFNREVDNEILRALFQIEYGKSEIPPGPIPPRRRPRIVVQCGEEGDDVKDRIRERLHTILEMSYDKEITDYHVSYDKRQFYLSNHIE